MPRKVCSSSRLALRTWDSAVFSRRCLAPLSELPLLNRSRPTASGWPSSAHNDTISFDCSTTVYHIRRCQLNSNDRKRVVQALDQHRLNQRPCGTIEPDGAVCDVLSSWANLLRQLYNKRTG